jgi:hypothetical protein
MKRHKSFRLSEGTLALAERIASKFGLSQAGAIEYSVRRIGEIEGLPPDPPPPAKPKPRRTRKATPAK